MIGKQRRDRKRKKAEGSLAVRNGHSRERFQQRQSSCDRRAQSLLEVVSEQNVVRMRGKEIHSVILRKQTRKRKEERLIIYKITNKVLAVISISFSVSFISQLTVFLCTGFRSIAH